MIMDDDTLISKLKELVVDENKIVTCKLLHQQFNIEMQKSKKILQLFSENQQNTEHCKMCYILTGFISLNDNMIYRVALSNQDKLNDAKSQFANLLSCTVFSVQKMDIKDSGLLYANQIVEQATDFPFKPAPIQSSSITIRCPIQTTTVIQPFIEVKESTVNKNAPNLNNTNSKTKGSIANAFAKTIVSKTVKENNESKMKPNIKTDKKKPISTNQGSLAQAFAKAPPKKSPPAPPQVKENTKEKKIDIKAKVIVKSKTTQKKTAKIEEETEKDILSSSSDEEEVIRKPAKKMRRIIMADSDSDEEIIIEDKSKENEFESRKVIESSDEFEEPIPKRKNPLIDKKSSNIISLNSSQHSPVPIGKHMELKAINSTYTDDEGFLVTIKEKKLVEVDNDEPMVEEKIKSPNLNIKNKQSTLSSFFKRKM